MKPLLLALDIGNVCIYVDHRNFATALGLPEIPTAAREIFRDYECGTIAGEEDFFNRLSEVFNRQYSLEQLKKAFNDILISPVPGMTDLVNDFAKIGVKAVFFSDISPTHLRRTGELFDAFNAVSGGTFSFVSGAWKPTNAMFEYFEQHYGIPDLYVDDREELISAARKRGWNAHRFISAEDLRKKLPDAG